MVDPDELPFLDAIAAMDALLVEVSHAAAPAWDPQTARIRAQLRLQLLTAEERRELARTFEATVRILRLALDELRFWTARADRPAAPDEIHKAPLLRAAVWNPHVGLDEAEAVAWLRAIWTKLDPAGRALLLYGLQHLPERGILIARGAGGAVRVTLPPE